MVKIRDFLKKVMYPNKWSGDAYIEFCRNGGASIGKNVTVYNAMNTVIDETSLPFIYIGDNVQITAGTTILAHDYSYSVLGNVYGELPRQQRNTKIGNNVFIGMNCTILMGATIGDNVIIGAGSIVSGNIDSNSVYAGNPAKKICELDVFLEKSRLNFETSARCYYDGIKRAKGDVEAKDMIVYQALFLTKEEMISVIHNSNFRSIENKSQIDMSKYKKYLDFEHFRREKK